MTPDQALGSIGEVVSRTPYPYATSWPLEQLELREQDGATTRVLVKRLEGGGSGKPPFIVDPEREIEAYGLLSGAGLGTAACLASGTGWLALEQVDGVPLWQRGDLEAWEATAAWAARLHARFAGRELGARHLLRHDQRFYRRWLVRARARLGERIEPLRGVTELAIRRLVSLPTTLIHGELYASNVLIGSERVAAIDWEMAALGPGVIDLAALVTGWDPESEGRLIAAFGGVRDADLAAAKLMLAIQWLGWGEGWEAPPEHRRDWLAEAREAARVLG